MIKRYTYVIDNGKDTIYDLFKKGVILENFIDIEETLNLQQEKIIELEKEIARLLIEVEALKCTKTNKKRLGGFGMTKRFTYDYDGDDQYYDKGLFKDNGHVLKKDELLECLNALNEENEQLKQLLLQFYTEDEINAELI